jgi:prepilin-type N-terminal cleavage/methylation domain-containing protein
LSLKRLKDESGYSLVEVMVAIMILAIAIIPMVSMFDAGLRAAVLGGNYDKGRALANEELEEIKALPFKKDPNPPADSVVEIYPPGTRSCTGAIEAGFTCQVQTTYALLGASGITPDASARTMMQVTVTVSWSGGTNSFTTTGLVSRGAS